MSRDVLPNKQRRGACHVVRAGAPRSARGRGCVLQWSAECTSAADLARFAAFMVAVLRNATSCRRLVAHHPATPKATPVVRAAPMKTPTVLWGAASTRCTDLSQSLRIRVLDARRGRVRDRLGSSAGGCMHHTHQTHTNPERRERTQSLHSHPIVCHTPREPLRENIGLVLEHLRHHALPCAGSGRGH